MKTPTKRKPDMLLEEIGLTKEEIQERVVDRLVERLMTDYSSGDDGRAWSRSSEFAVALEDAVKNRVDIAVNELADKHVLPNVTDYIEKLTLRETNKWGEPKGEPVTFVEYLTQRAERYMTEEVNYEGKSKEENVYESWSKSQTRIAHLIHKHLHYSIETMVKNALASANNAIASGIAETVKIKLKEVTDKLRLTVEAK